jgi:transcriptional regulator with XRE-family HTH domain
MGNIELVKEAIEKSGITREEAASLMRITRNTLYRWFEGKPSRNKIIEEYAVFQAKKLLLAVGAGRLPLVKNTANRFGAIHDALK